MYEIILRSAQKGEWVDIPVNELNPAKDLYALTDTRAGESPLSEGLINLKINGLVTVENVEGVKVVRVTRKFIDFYNKRISQ